MSDSISRQEFNEYKKSQNEIILELLTLAGDTTKSIGNLTDAVTEICKRIGVLPGGQSVN